MFEDGDGVKVARARVFSVEEVLVYSTFRGLPSSEMESCESMAASDRKQNNGKRTTF
jgi:hypothetical protein